MAYIELVIKIPEEVFKRTVFYREFRDLNDCVTTIKALEKAVPLPEHHGDLIDRNDLLKHYDSTTYHNGIEERKIHFVQIGYVNDAPTIIEGSDSE